MGLVLGCFVKNDSEAVNLGGMVVMLQAALYGAGWEQVSFRVLCTLALSLIYMAAGVWIFQRLQMQRNG